MRTPADRLRIVAGAGRAARSGVTLPPRSPLEELRGALEGAFPMLPDGEPARLEREHVERELAAAQAARLWVLERVARMGLDPFRCSPAMADRLAGIDPPRVP
jgi:hypothetical protein